MAGVNYPLARKCRHLDGDNAYLHNDCLIIEAGEEWQDILVLCPLCAKLAREKVLSDLFKDAANAAVKSAMLSFRVHSR